MKHERIHEQIDAILATKDPEWIATLRITVDVLYAKVQADRKRPSGLRVVPAVVYECGICDSMHPWDWSGDCREDANRFEDVPPSTEVRSWADRQSADEGKEPKK